MPQDLFLILRQTDQLAKMGISPLFVDVVP
ncbi:hypothetical protein DSM3645_02573 [Blastopirellula marina DSM 3645]|uniref:Uncharacterized protein n=1 Tax=Blastopirellula marina DSM 3645 TaxID=314230 RepID=A3ZVH8_9BACT|nr:hypothetical protein DSM3645_02573 [Blastopirellula marina DSM 3645]